MIPQWWTAGEAETEALSTGVLEALLTASELWARHKTWAIGGDLDFVEVADLVDDLHSVATGLQGVVNAMANQIAADDDDDDD